jgi:hypothetical protein
MLHIGNIHTDKNLVFFYTVINAITICIQIKITRSECFFFILKIAVISCLGFFPMTHSDQYQLY